MICVPRRVVVHAVIEQGDADRQLVGRHRRTGTLMLGRGETFALACKHVFMPGDLADIRDRIEEPSPWAGPLRSRVEGRANHLCTGAEASGRVAKVSSYSDGWRGRNQHIF